VENYLPQLLSSNSIILLLPDLPLLLFRVLIPSFQLTMMGSKAQWEQDRSHKEEGQVDRALPLSQAPTRPSFNSKLPNSGGGKGTVQCSSRFPLDRIETSLSLALFTFHFPHHLLQTFSSFSLNNTSLLLY